jgi:membrane protein DedA with SNARE-associated domain
MNIQSVSLMIALSLFLGGLGLPIPENPVLLGGGYAIFRQVSPVIISLLLWYLAILFGDILLFATAYWFFRRPATAGLLHRYVGNRRINGYEAAFSCWGGWMLFLARFTFGVRAVAYVAAGAARYPWPRFLIVDGLSVAIQVLLFVGIGYYAGERVEWAQASGEKVAVVLCGLALISVAVMWLSSAFMQKLSGIAKNKEKSKSDDPSRKMALAVGEDESRGSSWRSKRVYSR